MSGKRRLFKSLQERLDEQRIKRQQEQLVKRGEITRYESDAENGLSDEQAAEHYNAGWYNEAMDSCTKSVKDIIISNTFTYFNLIFVVLGVLLIIVGSFRNLTFLPVIFANSAIGIFQELRAKKVLDKMNMLNAPMTKVVRIGQISVIKTQELVADDVVIFTAGSQICADAIVLSGSVLVNEALLTGESDDIVKQEGAALMSGSFVVSGGCRARLENVGRDSYISKLTMEAKSMGSGEESEMIRSLNNLLKWVGICIIPMGVLLLWQGMNVNMESFPDAVLSSRLLPPLYARSLKLAYSSGSFESVWKRISSNYHEETQRSLMNLTAVIEPAMIVILGLLIGAILLMLMIPMMNIMSVLG